MKKNLLILCICLFISGITTAQTINIPDLTFKNFLLNYTPTIDTNGDSEIQVSEAEAVTELFITDIPSQPILNLEGLEAFINVINLNINCYQITYVNLSGLIQLGSVSLSGQHLENVNLQNLTGLASLNISASTLQSLDITDLINLQTLALNYLNLESISYDTLPYLEEIIIHGIIEHLNLSGLPSVNHIYLLGDFATVNISGCESLVYFEMNNFSYGGTTELVMGNNINMESFIFRGDTQNIDLSDCINIENVNIDLVSASDDASVNLKNGNINYSSPIYPISSITINDSYNCYVCIDEGENQNIEFGNNIITSTYCTFTPGGDYNTIIGEITFDNNGDGCDALDPVVQYPSIQINDGTETGYAFSPSGSYIFYTQAGTFTLTPVFENAWFTANSETVIFEEVDNSTVTQNFCVTPNGVHNDVEVTIVPTLPAQPGFEANYKILYRNKGNQTLSGDVTFTFDDNVLDYVSATPVETASSTGSLSWSYTDLLPFESREILLILNVNSPMENPAVNVDDVLTFTAAITPDSADETPEDNSVTFNQVVVGSYDPNDITCLEGETVSPEKIGEYLHYNVNFENTGNAPATFVVVKDTIDTTKFDISTLQVLNASHAMEARITDNIAEFYFDDINLEAEGGKGNVTFKIKTLESLEVNSNVTQQANIYFDYNWPVETNEAVTTFATLSAAVFDKDASVEVYPNPVKNTVNIAAANELVSADLYDVQGRLLQTITLNGIEASVDISGRAAGLYFIKITTLNGAIVEKIVKE